MLIDVILLLILIACALSGYRKGLLMSLMGLLVIVLCCLGAAAAQNALTPWAVDYLEPKLADHFRPGIQEELTQSVHQTVEEQGSVAVGELRIDLKDLLAQLGIDLEEAVNQGTSEAVESASEAAATALARIFAQKIAGAMIFIAAFLILYLILHSVALAVNVVDRLPVVHTCNRIGGLLLNLGAALLAMIVAAAVLRQAELLPAKPGPLTSLLTELSQELL